MVQFLKKKHSDTLDFLKKLEPELQIFRFEKAACGYSDLSPKEKQEQMLNIKNALGSVSYTHLGRGRSVLWYSGWRSDCILKN